MSDFGIGFSLPECTVTGDHYWHGGVCSACDARLRCGCGQFQSIDRLAEHINSGSCPIVLAFDPAPVGGKP